jgi:hypothetical protein
MERRGPRRVESRRGGVHTNVLTFVAFSSSCLRTPPMMMRLVHNERQAGRQPSSRPQRNFAWIFVGWNSIAGPSADAPVYQCRTRVSYVILHRYHDYYDRGDDHHWRRVFACRRIPQPGLPNPSSLTASRIHACALLPQPNMPQKLSFLSSALAVVVGIVWTVRALPSIIV